jgi:hypothetical protein
MDPKQVRWKGLDWIHMAEGWDQRVAIVNTVKKLSSCN